MLFKKRKKNARIKKKLNLNKITFMSVIDATGLIDFDSIASRTMRILVDHSIMLNQETVNFAVDGIQDRNSIFDEMSFFR